MAGRLYNSSCSGALHSEFFKKVHELTSSQCFIYPLMILIVVSGSQMNYLQVDGMFLSTAGVTNLGGGRHIQELPPNTVVLLLKVGFSAPLVCC